MDERLLAALGELLRAGARELGFDLVDVDIILIRGEIPKIAEREAS